MPEKNRPESPDLPDLEEEVELSQEEISVLLALDRAQATAALEREDPAALALATEFINIYAGKISEALRAGKDYLPLFAGSSTTPAIERIAMEIVLESIESELESEY